MNKLLITLLLAVCSQADAQYSAGIVAAAEYRLYDQQRQALNDYREQSLQLQREALSLQREALEQQRQERSARSLDRMLEDSQKRLRCSISYEYGC